MKHLLLFFILNVYALTAFAQTKTIRSCDRDISFTKVPERAVSHDINLTEMMFALGLQERMVGYTGVSGWQKLTDEFLQKAGKLPQLAEKYPTIENLLAVNADFLFAGWNYGMRVGGPLTPNTLKPFGIKVYELTESCIHITKKPPSHFDDVYNDLQNLGKIFNVEKKANILINDFKTQLAEISSVLNQVKKPKRVFLYDSGKDAPFTAGLYAIPTVMIEAAGGRNILDGLNTSWATTSWETVVEQNPEHILIIDYGKTSTLEKIQFLLSHPALQKVDAIIHKRFVTLAYSEATPSVKNFSATKKLAKAFHPERF